MRMVRRSSPLLCISARVSAELSAVCPCLSTNRRPCWCPRPYRATWPPLGYGPKHHRTRRTGACQVRQMHALDHEFSNTLRNGAFIILKRYNKDTGSVPNRLTPQYTSYSTAGVNMLIHVYCTSASTCEWTCNSKISSITNLYVLQNM